MPSDVPRQRVSPEGQRSALNRWVPPQLCAAPVGPGADRLGPRCPLSAGRGVSVPRSRGGCREAGQNPLAWAGLEPASPLQQDLTVFAPDGAAVRPQAGNGSPFRRLRAHPLHSPDPDPGGGTINNAPFAAPWHGWEPFILLPRWPSLVAGFLAQIKEERQGQGFASSLPRLPPLPKPPSCGPGRLTPSSRGLPEAARRPCAK